MAPKNIGENDFNNKFKLLWILNEKKIYYSSYIRRFYNLYKDKSKIYKYVEKLKKNIE